MLTLLVGTPGSGKTLYAIDKIKKISNQELEEFKNIEFVYTNISGFKYEFFKDNKVQFLKLSFDELYIHLKLLYGLFKQHEKDDNLDDYLIEYCNKNNLINSYFIIDEAHNYFDNQDKIKMWWLTYHRHLHHEILFITQNKSIINTQYRNIPEIFIKALPRSKAISKNTLRYNCYTEYRMTNKYSTIEIKVNKTYFDLYKSGNVSNQKLVGKKYIIIFLILLVSLILIFSFFVYKFYFSNPLNNDTNLPELKKLTQQTKENIPEQTQFTPTSQLFNKKPITQYSDTKDLKLYKFNCFDEYCYYFEKNNTFQIPTNILKTYLSNLEHDRKYIKLKNNRLIIHILDDKNKFNFLKGDEIDDKKTNTFNILN